MPGRYREALVLCYLEGLTCEAAAVTLRRPVGTVHAYFGVARTWQDGGIKAAR
jgi:DNA-directed RNA polymerase specialized sigma24 family protein